MTVRDALRFGAERLTLQGDLRETAVVDARQLLEVATGVDRVGMLAAPERTLSADEAGQFEALLERRVRAEPVQYLRGLQGF